MGIRLIQKPKPGTLIDSPEAQEFMDDYELVSSWWKHHGWEPVPVNCLPFLGAFILAPDGKELAAGWLYQDNSCPVCMLEWLVARPDTNAIRTVKALKNLINYFQAEAKSLGYHFMMSTSKNEALTRCLQSQDFQVTDTGVSHLINILTD